MGCNCGDAHTIDVYVELAGKEKYHETLKGRNEENQHPISAITNLSETIEEINNNIEEVKEESNSSIEELKSKISDLAISVNKDLEDLKTKVDENYTELNSKISEVSKKVDNIDLNNYYTKSETNLKLESTMRWKGSVTDKESLPVVNEIGDVWNVVKTGANYVWTGIGWDNLSPSLCLKKYATRDYVDGAIEASAKLLQEHLHVHYYDKDEIDEMIAEIDPSSTSNALVYKGTVASYDNLPTVASIGDTYKALDSEEKYFWNGFDWEPFGGLIDETYSKDEIDQLLKYKADSSAVDEQVADLQEQIDANKKAIQEEETASEWYKIADVINNE